MRRKLRVVNGGCGGEREGEGNVPLQQPAPQVWVSPPEPNRPMQPIASAWLLLPPPSPMQLSTPSAPSSALPPGTPMDVDALRIARAREHLANCTIRLAEASAATAYALPPAPVISHASSDSTGSTRGWERSGLQMAHRGCPFHGH